MSKFAPTERISQILPTVKCSDCGRDVHIHRLGDHLCSSMPPIPALPILQPAGKNPTSVSPSPVTPPYYGLRPSLSTKDEDGYRDELFGSNCSSPQAPTFLGMRDQYPRKNSTSPAPPSSPYRAPKEHEYFEQDTEQYSPNTSPKPSLSATPKTKMGGALDTLMADLLNTIHDSSAPRRGIFSSDDVCGACGDDFDYRDDVVHIGDKSYHKPCYTCRMCRAPFNSLRACHEHEGHLYCERDYNVVKKRTICATCDRSISSITSAIKVRDRFYHPGHIACDHCNEPFHTQSALREHQDKVYCREDFKQLILPQCRACHKPVEKEAVSALDGKLQGKWHVGCFGCHTCHQPFPDNTFYVFDNAPYCKRHYHQLNNSLCRTCDHPIEGPCAQTIEGWRFHPACFRCNVCRCSITDTYYMYERRIYCENHIRQLQQQQRHVRAEKRHTQFGRI